MTQEQGIADALTASIANDGQTPILAAIPFSSQQITLLAAATTRTGAMNLGQFQDGCAVFASLSGSGQYVGGLSPTLTGYPDGLTIRATFPQTNGASTATLNIDGVGIVPLVDASGTQLAAAAIKVGIANVLFKASKAYYMPPFIPVAAVVTKAIYNLTDGGQLASGTAAVGSIYLINATGTTGTIATDQSATVGDAFGITKYGTGVLYVLLGPQLFKGASGPLITPNEGTSIMRYTGTARGWVEG